MACFSFTVLCCVLCELNAKVKPYDQNKKMKTNIYCLFNNIFKLFYIFKTKMHLHMRNIN